MHRETFRLSKLRFASVKRKRGGSSRKRSASGLERKLLLQLLLPR